MAEYETQIHQLRLSNDSRPTDNDYITMVEPRTLFSPEVRKGSLYIVTEADQTVAGGREACHLVRRTIQKTFYDDTSLSVTSSLREAMRAANKALYHQNFHAAPSRRIGVGVTCVVLKGNDLFIAQVVPSQMYILTNGQNGHVRFIPPHPYHQAYATTTTTLTPGALGSSLSVEPELYRSPFGPGQHFLICSSTIAATLNDTAIQQIAAMDNAAAIIETLHTLCHTANCEEGHALAVTLAPCSPEHQRAQINKPPGLAGRLVPVLHTIGAWLRRPTPRPIRQTPTAAPEPPAPEPDTDQTGSMPEQPDLPLPSFPKPSPIDVGESMQQRYEREQPAPASTRIGEAPPDQHKQATRSSEAVDLSGLPTTPVRPYRPRRTRRPVVDMPWYQQLLVPFQAVGTAIAERVQTSHVVKNVVSPSQRVVRQTQPGATQHQRKQFPWLIFISLGLFVTVLILYGTNLARHSAEQRDLEYLEQARHYLDTMQEAPDQQSAMQHLENARQALNQVRSSPQVTETNPTLWLPFKEVEYEYEQGLAKVQRLTFFDRPEILARHPLPNGRFDSVVVPPPTSIVTDSATLETLRYIYALDGDRSNAQLYRIPRDGGEAEVYLSPNEMVQNTLVGPLQAISWRIDNVVAVDQGTNNFGYYFRTSGTWNYIRLGGSEIWAPRGRIDLETYEGNLYFWGAEDEEIIKFTSGRYGDLPQLWLDTTSLESIDLSAAIDLAVDGQIYLLMPRGTIAVFQTGVFEREIVPETITPPITSVTRFFITGTPNDGWVFLIDTLNERIIQMDKQDGTVIQQMSVRPDSHVRLDQLTDLYVDDSGGRPLLYLINGGEIIRVALPAPPGSFANDNATDDTTDNATTED